MTYARMGKIVRATEWLEKAKKEYTGYLLETMIHFRVHCATRHIKRLAKETNNEVASSDSDESLSTISTALEAKEVDFNSPPSLQKIEPVLTRDIIKCGEEIAVNL